METVHPNKRCSFLVVEDEALIAFSIEDTLKRLGHDIVGPVSKLDKALIVAQEGHFDAAILDVTIRGGETSPVAKLLCAKGIPFAIASGYDDLSLPDDMKGRQRLTKPFSDAQLENMIRALCSQATAVECGA